MVDDDGVEHPVDTLIFATGFHVTDSPAPGTTFGRDGRSLAQVWDGSPRAYRGVTVAGFPNLFLLLGPGTGLGHNSVVTMVEAQVEYLVSWLKELHRVGATVLEVRPGSQEAFDARLQHDLAPTVWASGGCRSWYLDSGGRVAAIWPGTVLSYRRLMRRFDPEAYEVGSSADVGRLSLRR